MFARNTAAALAAVAFVSSTLLAFQAAKPTVTGAWAGTLVVNAGGETHEKTVHLVLKQDGAVVTGSAGPDADRQYPIRKGKTATTAGVIAVSFEVIADGEHLMFDLKLVDGRLKGNAKVEGEDGQPLTAVVELKPVK